MGEALGPSFAPELVTDDVPNHPEFTSNTQDKSLLGKLACASIDQEVEQRNAELGSLATTILQIVCESETPLSSGRVYELLSSSRSSSVQYHKSDNLSGALVSSKLQQLDADNLIKEIEPDSAIYAHPDYDYDQYLALFGPE